jgi:hypothetical protein
MNFELNTLVVAVFFAPMVLLVLGNVMDLAGNAYQALSLSQPTPRPATIAPQSRTYQAANDALVRVAA